MTDKSDSPSRYENATGHTNGDARRGWLQHQAGVTCAPVEAAISARWALVIRELGRFSVVGTVNVLMYYAIYLVLHLLLPYLVAHVVAYVATIGTSFLLNCYFTYRTRPTLRKFLLFPLTQLAGLITTSVGVTVLVEWVGLDERSSPMFATAVAVPVSFLLSRLIITGRVWRPIPEDDGSRYERILSPANLR